MTRLTTGWRQANVVHRGMSRLAILVATSLVLWMALVQGFCLADPPQGRQSRLEIVDGSKVEPITPELVASMQRLSTVELRNIQVDDLAGKSARSRR